MINNAAAQSRLFAPGARKSNRQPGQLSTTSMYGYLHLASLPRRARRIACFAHSAYQPSAVQTSLAWPWLWIFALSLRVFAFVFYSVSPLSHRHHDGLRGQPLRCQSQFRKPTRVTADQESPTDDPTAATDGGSIARAADERHLRQRIDPVEYWPCNPRLSTQSAARNLYLHRGGDICERERQAPAYREHLFFSSPSFLPLLSPAPASNRASCRNCLCWSRIYFIPGTTSRWTGPTFDSRPRLLAADLCDPLGHHPFAACLWGSSSFPFLIWNSPPGQSSIHTSSYNRPLLRLSQRHSIST